MTNWRALVAVDCSAIVICVVLLAVFAHGGVLIAGSLALVIQSGLCVRNWVKLRP